jgi:hypothetical protein
MKRYPGSSVDPVRQSTKCLYYRAKRAYSGKATLASVVGSRIVEKGCPVCPVQSGIVSSIVGNGNLMPRDFAILF